MPAPAWHALVPWESRESRGIPGVAWQESAARAMLTTMPGLPLPSLACCPAKSQNCLRLASPVTMLDCRTALHLLYLEPCGLRASL